MENRETARTKNVVILKIGEKTIHLLGTVHVSAASVAEVRQTMEAVRPDTVCLELCHSRYEAMRCPGTPVLSPLAALKRGQFHLWLMGGVIALFYKYLSRKFDIQPGAEMLEAGRLAAAFGAVVVPVDREVELTLERLWNAVGFLGKTRLFFRFLADFLFSLGLNREKIEAMKQPDHLEQLIETLGRALPEVKRVLIDERDAHIAARLADGPGTRIVAVVGAGHLKGIVRELENTGKAAILSPDEKKD